MVEDEEDSCWRRTSPRSLACLNQEGKGVFEVGAQADLPYLSLLQTPTLSRDDSRQRDRCRERQKGEINWEVYGVRCTKENKGEGEKP